MRSPSQATLVKHLRHQRILELVKAGQTPRQISRATGIPTELVNRDIREVMATVVADTPTIAREAMAIDLARLDGLLNTWWPRAIKGDVEASREVRAIIEARRVIFGYGAAARLDIRAVVINWAMNRGLNPEEVIGALGDMLPI